MKLLLVAAIVLCVCVVHSGAADDLLIARKGRAVARIILAGGSTEQDRLAARELSAFLQQVSGAAFTVIGSTEGLNPAGGALILVGAAAATSLAGGTEFDLKSLGSEGILIQTLPPDKKAGLPARLVLAGPPDSPRGTLYAVNTFLEDVVGCRWYTADASFVPRKRSLSVGALKIRYVPPIQWRAVYYFGAMDEMFAMRQKLNGNASIVTGSQMTQERHQNWGTWCHTFFSYVSPDKYMSEHPEYFALTGGQRKATQLCLTNPDVLKITLERLKEMETEALKQKWPPWADPAVKYWDISQMDTGGNCACSNCAAIDNREGTPMGSLLTFINQVAEALPDKTISTLAYSYTQRPPKTLKPAPNVLIKLTNISCMRGLPIENSPFGNDEWFANDLRNWSAICKNLFVWDYVINFANLFGPMPNLQTLQPNVQFLVRNNVRGLFSQGNREIGGEFCHLRAYLLAKLEWNPDCDINAVMDDFLNGYYGPAGRPIRTYIDEMHAAVVRSGKEVGICDAPAAHRDNYLSAAMLERYDALFDKAEKLVAQDATLLYRVRTARMPLMYARLETGAGSPELRWKCADQFLELAKANNILRVTEWGVSPQEYFDRKAAELQKEKPR